MDLRTLINVNHVLHQSKLSYSEVLVLGYVANNPNTAVGALYKQTHLAPAAVSRILNNLEEMGMIDRTLDVLDKRKLRLRLTPVGARAYDTISKEMVKL
jgi:DNA-binding MarR family transcriptional regulator